MSTSRFTSYSVRFGKPAPGKRWCGGYKREPHQVSKIKNKGHRCKECENAYMADYRKSNPGKAMRQRCEATPAPVPGNDGLLNLPSWGYRATA